MEHPTASYAGAYPFAVTRTVKWGDCDPAGIIYTPRVLDYAMEILEALVPRGLGGAVAGLEPGHGARRTDRAR